MNYDFTKEFSMCADKSEAQKLYRKLSKKYHPDLGGCVEAMKAINSAYESWTCRRTGRTFDDFERAVMSKLQEILGLGLPDSVIVELIGTWVWVSGDTKTHKEAIKGVGMRWNSKRKMWYWTQAKPRKSRYNRNATIDDIRSAHGSKVFNSRCGAVAV